MYIREHCPGAWKMILGHISRNTIFLVSLIIRISACNKKDRVRLDVMEYKNSKSLKNIWWNNKIKALESFFF